MSTIPTRVRQEQFETHILPYLRTAQRGYTSKTPLYRIFNLILYRLHTGCQWNELPVPKGARNRKKKPSWQAVYHHYRKWSTDGSLELVWQGSIMTISQDIDLQYMNLDGSHAIAKKGGEAVAYQGRKRAKNPECLAYHRCQWLCGGFNGHCGWQSPR